MITIYLNKSYGCQFDLLPNNPSFVPNVLDQKNFKEYISALYSHDILDEGCTYFVHTFDGYDNIITITAIQIRETEVIDDSSLDLLYGRVFYDSIDAVSDDDVIFIDILDAPGFGDSVIDYEDADEDVDDKDKYL